jgi:hypothetical protein
VGSAVNCHQRVFENKLNPSAAWARLFPRVGTKTSIYGTITKVEKDDVDDAEKFTVTYTDESRN